MSKEIVISVADEENVRLTGGQLNSDAMIRWVTEYRYFNIISVAKNVGHM